jgi:hypothetical protein
MNPIVNLQVYQPPKPKPRPIVEEDPNKLDASLFLPALTGGPFFPPQYNMLNAMVQPQVPTLPTIIKNYNISAPGPTGLHEKISYIYEDMLPSINIPGKIITLKDRNSLQHYLRSILFVGGDGRDMNLDERTNSLMQYIKYMDLNPYTKFKLTPNPYMTLPDNFLLYRSCYPIVNENGIIKCAKNSIGMHLRVYKLSEGAYYINRQRDDFKLEKTNFPEWREILYYEYIRENVIKKNKCPNFINLYGYYINEESNIDFNKLRAIKGIEPLKQQPTSIRLTDAQNPGSGLLNAAMQTLNVGTLSNVNTAREIPNFYNGKALIALTEAPLYNILEWASTNYVRSGSSKRMISTGYYNENIWYSILFQIMVALAVLQDQEIYFNNFSIQDNIFIKDLSAHTNLTNFWKYRIDAIDYYIPNYGFMAVFDAYFGDNCTVDNMPKLYGKFLGDNKNKEHDIKELIFNNMFKQIFDPINFNTDSFIENGGICPPPAILKLLSDIHNCQDDSCDIKYYIALFFSRFINNRVGTYLRELEIPNIRRDETNFEKGRIVVNEVGANTYKFVLVLGPDIENDQLMCILTITDEDSNFKKVSAPRSTLLGYNRGETIDQAFKVNEVNLNEDELIETYIV